MQRLQGRLGEMRERRGQRNREAEREMQRKAAEETGGGEGETGTERGRQKKRRPERDRDLAPSCQGALPSDAGTKLPAWRGHRSLYDKEPAWARSVERVSPCPPRGTGLQVSSAISFELSPAPATPECRDGHGSVTPEVTPGEDLPAWPGVSCRLPPRGLRWKRPLTWRSRLLGLRGD